MKFRVAGNFQTIVALTEVIRVLSFHAVAIYLASIFQGNNVFCTFCYIYYSLETCSLASNACLTGKREPKIIISEL